jgi:hypothetical protein
VLVLNPHTARVLLRFISRECKTFGRVRADTRLQVTTFQLLKREQGLIYNSQSYRVIRYEVCSVSSALQKAERVKVCTFTRYTHECKLPKL